MFRIPPPSACGTFLKLATASLKTEICGGGGVCLSKKQHELRQELLCCAPQRHQSNAA